MDAFTVSCVHLVLVYLVLFESCYALHWKCRKSQKHTTTTVLRSTSATKYLLHIKHTHVTEFSLL